MRSELIPAEEERLATDEAARIIRVGPRTLEKWRLFGKGPRYEKVGTKLVRYRYGDLLTWLEAQKRGGQSDDHNKRSTAGAATGSPMVQNAKTKTARSLVCRGPSTQFRDVL